MSEETIEDLIDQMYERIEGIERLILNEATPEPVVINETEDRVIIIDDTTFLPKEVGDDD